MKIAWVTNYDAVDPNSYCGRGYYAPRSLQAQSIDVEYIGPLQLPVIPHTLARVKRRFYNSIPFIPQDNKRWYSFERSPEVLQDWAKQISRKLEKLNTIDIVCSGASQWSQPVAYLDCQQPIVIWTDSTFADVLDFYPEYFKDKICQASIRDGLENEKAALNRAKLLIYASEWAAQSAIKHHNIDPSIIKIVPWGANLETNFTLSDIKTIVQGRPADRCKLLFIGFDWQRKGGDTALQVTESLNKAGLDTELTIVGCSREELGEKLPDYVNFIGSINKNTEQGLNSLFQLMMHSHFLILPTRADASPHALCEAGSFALPCLTTDVGGIPTIVRDNLNGMKFALDAPIEEYSTYISDLFSNYTQYQNLALSSFYEYESRLNWSVAGKVVKELLREIVPQRKLAVV